MKFQGKSQPDAGRSLAHPEERKLLAEIAARNERLQRPRKVGVPEVGLFFMVNGKVFADGKPVIEVPACSAVKTYEVGHPEYWRQLQRMVASVGAAVELSAKQRPAAGVGGCGGQCQADRARGGTVGSGDCGGRPMKSIAIEVVHHEERDSSSPSPRLVRDSG